MKKLDIVLELKRLDPTLKAAQGRRLLTLTVKTLQEVLRQQRVWAGADDDDFDDGILRPIPLEAEPSPFWRHRDRDGAPVLPWTIPTGGPDDDDDTGGDVFARDDIFATEGYSYEDFDRDWGGYEYEDTGYPDEDA